MTQRRWFGRGVAGWVTVLAACGGNSATSEPTDTSVAADTAGGDVVADAADTVVTPDFAGAPPAICNAAHPWTGGKTFTDVTALAFSVDVTQVTGMRLSTADLDGDLKPEVSVRSMGGVGQREVFGAGKRNLWILKNASTGNDLRFSDITQASGITMTRDGSEGRQMHVVVFGDVDNDGDLDAFCGNSVINDVKNTPPKDKFPQDSSELMINDGKGHFSLASTASFATKDLRRALSSASFVDYDRDGKLDLWLGYMTWGTNDLPIPDQLVQGDGAGNFVAVTEAEGLMTKAWSKQADIEAGTVHRHTWATAACDMDNDGNQDLLTASYGRYFNSYWNGGFKAESGARYVDWKTETHLDRDDQDDWRTNINAQCYCQENPKAAECDTCYPPEIDCPALKAAFGGGYRWSHASDRKPYRLGGNTGLITCADLDRDGDLDLVEGTIVHPDVGPTSDPTRVIRNDGGSPPQFVHLHADESGLKTPGDTDDVGDMAGAVFDFDNDGQLDILIASSDYPGTRVFLFHQNADGTFAEVPVAEGIDHKHAHGVAVADFDRDGDLDVVLGHSTMRCNLSPSECYKTEEVHVFANGQAASNYLQIQLQGTGGSNRSAVGARVWVKTGNVTQMAEVGGGYGHFGAQNELVLHFGLGEACAVDEVKVRWPDGSLTTQIWNNVRANYLVRLTQGDAKPAYPLAKP